MQRFKEVLPTDVRVTVLADRSFGDLKLYDYLRQHLGFDFVIRFRGNIKVTDTKGESRTAQEWVGVEGRARKLKQAKVIGQAYAKHRGCETQFRDTKHLHFGMGLSETSIKDCQRRKSKYSRSAVKWL